MKRCLKPLTSQFPTPNRFSKKIFFFFTWRGIFCNLQWLILGSLLIHPAVPPLVPINQSINLINQSISPISCVSPIDPLVIPENWNINSDYIISWRRSFADPKNIINNVALLSHNVFFFRIGHFILSFSFPFIKHYSMKYICRIELWDPFCP